MNYDRGGYSHGSERRRNRPARQDRGSGRSAYEPGDGYNDSSGQFREDASGGGGSRGSGHRMGQWDVRDGRDTRDAREVRDRDGRDGRDSRDGQESRRGGGHRHRDRGDRDRDRDQEGRDTEGGGRRRQFRDREGGDAWRHWEDRSSVNRHSAAHTSESRHTFNDRTGGGDSLHGSNARHTSGRSHGGIHTHGHNAVHAYEATTSETAISSSGGSAAKEQAPPTVSAIVQVLAKLSKEAAPRSDSLHQTVVQLDNLLSQPNTAVSPKDLSDIAFYYAKLGQKDEHTVKVLTLVADRSKFLVDSFTPADLAGVVWGVASLNIRNEGLMSVVAAEVVAKISSFEAKYLANVAWAFSKCGLWNELLVKSIAGESLKKLDTFSAQSLSHIAWAMAHWSHCDEELLNNIAVQAQNRIKEFPSGPIAMIAWSFSSLKVKHQNLMNMIAEEADKKIAAFKNHDLAHLAYAFANLGIQANPLFKHIAEEIQKSIRSIHPPELSNFAWAFSKNNHANESMMRAIAEEAVSKMQLFKPSETAMLAWAFAVAGLHHKLLMTEIGSVVSTKIDQYTAQQLSHIAWAFGALSLRHTQLFKALLDHVYRTSNNFDATGLSNMAWALAMVSDRNESFLCHIAPMIARNISDLRPLSLARCTWAYRTLIVESPELMNAISSETLKRVDNFPTKAFTKLVDSVYITPMPNDISQLETAITNKTNEIAQILISTWTSLESWTSSNTTNSVDQNKGKLVHMGSLDCGLIGTPKILRQLGIEMPKADFIRRCRAQEWTSGNEQARAQFSNKSNKLYTVAAFKLITAEQTAEDWVIHYSEDQQRAPADGNPALQGQLVSDDPASWLVVLDNSGQLGRSETLYLVLKDLCLKIFEIGVRPGTCEECNVEGHVQMLSTILPCLSGIGLLQQFRVLFPTIKLHFVEQCSFLSDA